MKRQLAVFLLLSGCRLFGNEVETSNDAGTDPDTRDVQTLPDTRPEEPDLEVNDATVDLDVAVADATLDASDVSDLKDMGPCPLEAFEPLAWWSFDLINEGTGAYDNLGSDTTIGPAQILGGPSIVSTSAVRGNALSFDGVDDGAYIAHSAGLELAEGTVSIWVNPMPYGGAESLRGLFSKDGDGPQDGGHWSVFLTPENGLNYRTQTLVDNDDLFANPIPPNMWTHIAATFGPLGKRLYVNGVLATGDVATGSWFDVAQMVQNQQPIGIGFSTFSAMPGVIFPAVGYLQATIDEVMIFDRALDATEIVELRLAIQSECR